jgi:subtilisin family serine protease
VVVQTKSSFDPSGFSNVLRNITAQSVNIRTLRTSSGGNRRVLEIPEEWDVDDFIELLGNSPEIDFAERDTVHHIADNPTNDPKVEEQWALTKIEASRAWEREKGNTSPVLIGIVDGGIALDENGALNHPDLNDPDRYILGTDFVENDSRPRDENGHGTHVTGIAAAETNNGDGIAGLNWYSKVYVCRVFGRDGGGYASDFLDAVEEIVNYAKSNNMKAVINYSGGGGGSRASREACNIVNANGMLLCAASGNGGGGVIAPARYSVDLPDAVIAVGSTNKDDKVASSSGKGPELTVVAPGVRILSTTPPYDLPRMPSNYATINGTSMATPHVTGLAALLWSQNPGFTNRQVRDRITSTAHKLGSGERNDAWGFGRINAGAALAQQSG